MTKGKVLIVDDNKSILTALKILLTPEFFQVDTLSDPNQLLNLLQKEEYNLVILDMNFMAGRNTGNEGIYWLKRVLESYPDLSVVMITAYGDIELAVNALKAGAVDFILKPWDDDKLIATAHSALHLNLSKKEAVKKTKTKNQVLDTPNIIIGSSPKLMDVLNIVRKVAKTEANVLITGENGTGKELIAREIHRLSNRSGEVLVNVDMGAITETLFESELFGHMKGAFTDARENRPGKFEAANSGTLFLDEIGNLSIQLQSKLLTALQSRQITRIGSNQPIPVDIRLICATNRNLEQMVGEGLFREDLLYRINTILIEVPPLRERENDILLLADFFLKKYASKYNKPNLKLNTTAQEKLLNYSWPGNIRELQHTMEKAVIMCENSLLKAEDFCMRPILSGINLSDEITLEELEKRIIEAAIIKNNGNFTAAAEKLGITRQTIYNRIKRYES